ncbi:hypothetical protein F503_04809 [Ophiostoma piceae UAMH 11346]|uniref:Uncharacterized protein n=1 Tax=Ophiostoma piceae (strain UAMH 11346) TaxID=1262450 RepID=S3BWX2_OPHP1|nr:hypothetical protein F503_04809 [Ophiostoma piceae UAMH 11346]
MSPSRTTAGPSPTSATVRHSSSLKDLSPAKANERRSPASPASPTSPSATGKLTPKRVAAFTPPRATTATKRTTVVTSVSTSPSSTSSPHGRNSGKPSLADHTRNAMPHFVRKLLPPVSECV